MKTKVVKFLIALVFIVILLGINTKEVYASEASLSTTNCNVGENFNVTLNIPQDAVVAQGELTVTYSNGETFKKSIRLIGTEDYTTLHWPGNFSTSVEGKVAGVASVVVDNIILGASDSSKLNSISTLSTSVNINAPVTQPEPPAENNNTPEPPPQTTPDPVTNLEFSDTNEKMYTVRRVNIRQSYGTNSNIIQTLAEGTEVTRTGVSKGSADGYSWSRVSYNGVTGYIITGGLTYDAPAPVTEEPPEDENPDNEEPPEQKPEENTDEQNQELSDEEILAKISEELGVIPSVGVNIMPCMFLGSIVSCVYLMYIVINKK